MKKLAILLLLTLILGCQKAKNNSIMQGKVEYEQIAVVSKIPGKIVRLFVKEGDWVKEGDTLAQL
ncbi:MAG: biotin/lipoyl-binding protein, partial [Flavobacterium sp.]